MSAVNSEDVHAIETDPHEGSDSGYGEDESTYTESIRSSILGTLPENGRGYHKYRDAVQYILPEDEREQERLDMQHAMFLKSFGDKLFLAPIREPINEALDLGTGTGQLTPCCSANDRWLSESDRNLGHRFR